MATTTTTAASCRWSAVMISPRPDLQQKRTGAALSQAQSVNMRHPADRPHTLSADRMYSTDVRQDHRLMHPGQGA